MKKFSASVLVALAFLALAAHGAEAARSSATLTVSPAAPVAGDRGTVRGCGYDAGVVAVRVEGPSAITLLYVAVDDAGCFVSDGDFPAHVGQYDAATFQVARKALASATFTVTE